MSTFASSSRPRQPLIVKCSFNNNHSRITFPSSATCRIEALRARVQDCFQLSLSPFSINYTDDDGESTAIRSESDLTEAIAYFSGGDEWETTIGGSAASVSGYAPSYGIGGGGGGLGSVNGDGVEEGNDLVNRAYGIANGKTKGKITLKVHVEVEYDGPSLSDNGSVIDGQSSERLSAWDDDGVEEDDYTSSSNGTSSMRSGSSSRTSSTNGGMGGHDEGRMQIDRLRAAQQLRAKQVRDQTIFEESEQEDDEDASTEYGSRIGQGRRSGKEGERVDLEADEGEDYSLYPEEGLVELDLEDGFLDTGQDIFHGGVANGAYGERGYGRDGPGRAGSNRDVDYEINEQEFGPKNRRPSQSYTNTSSSLTASELGARWLREQTERVRKKTGKSSSSSSQASFSNSREASRNGRQSGRGSAHGSSAAMTAEEDEDDTALIDETRGELELVQNENGRWYYSYQVSDSASFHSNLHSDIHSRSDSLPLMPTQSQIIANGKRPDLSRQTSEPLYTSGPQSQNDYDMDRLASSLDDVGFEEAAAPPALAPDCSACGLRLEYMRYVCKLCGEGHFKMESHEGHTSQMEPGSSLSDEWAYPPHPSKSTAKPAFPAIETALADALTDHWREEESSPISPTTSDSAMTARNPFADTNGLASGGGEVALGKGPARAASSTSSSGSGTVIMGFELCPGCIEEQGIAHAREMFAKAQRSTANENALQVNGEQPIRAIQKRLNTLAHTYRELIWGARGWKDIEYNDECHCSICNVALYQNRFKCISCPNFNLCRSCHRNAQEIHPAHCFLSVPDQAKRLEAVAKANGALRAVNTAPQTIQSAIKHPGAFCHNCLQDIVGSRFHCAVCPSWDLCQDCEGVTSHVSGTGSHTADHIMMKIPLPLPSSEIEQVSRQARERWAQQDSSVVAAAGEILGSPSGRGAGAFSMERPGQERMRSASPTNETVYAGSAPRRTSARQAGGFVRDSLDHEVQCNGCQEWIMGKRYQCANCPSEPVPFNLCSGCEIRSHQLHNPFHVFIKFDRPVHYPLQSPYMILPILYKKSVGDVGPGVALDPAHPDGYLSHVVHPATICDIHVGPIQGAWMRCAHCAVSFDVCAECEEAADHDPGHVFVVFKSEVDMTTFRALTALSSNHYRPLIAQHVYV